MRTRALALSLLGCTVAVAGTWEAGQLSTAATHAGTAASSTTEPAPSSTSGSAASSSSASSASSSASSSPTASVAASRSPSGPTGTFAGTTDQTRYGPVQVEIIVKNGTITDVQALQLTNDSPRSASISAQAAPILRQEALKAQSAKVDTVSGATYTSDGYTTSLQSAIDKAGL
jgi:uncharacterized protein with FMN-binding domain